MPYSRRRFNPMGGRNRGRYRKSGYYGRYKKRYVRRGTTGSAIVEKKFLETLSNTSSIDKPGDLKWQSMLSVPLEPGESSRNGRKIVVTNISIRGDFHWYAANGGTDDSVAQTHYNKVRTIIFIDRQCNGASAEVADVFDQKLFTDQMYIYNNLANKGRFITLYDKIVTFRRNYIKPGEDTDIFQQTKEFKFYKKCRIPILYNGATGDTSERCCNNIHGIVFAIRNEIEEDSATLNYVQFTTSTRIRFMDI